MVPGLRLRFANLPDGSIRTVLKGNIQCIEFASNLIRQCKILLFPGLIPLLDHFLDFFVIDGFARERG